MIRWQLQIVLCFILCPLLLAQQAPATIATLDAAHSSAPIPAADAHQSVSEFVTIPRKTQIGLMLLDPVSSATSKRGDSIRYVIEKDVVVDGIIVIHAGTPVAGIITKVQRAVPHERDGRIEFEPKEVEIDKHHALRFTDSPPRPPKSWADRRDRINQTLRMIVTVPIWLPRLPSSLAGWNQEGRNEHPEPPQGKDMEFRVCYVQQYWFTQHVATIRVAELKSAPGNFAAASCSLSN